MTTRLLITGATGMVGSLVAKRAVDAGYSVRAMVRKNSDLSSLKDLPVELYESELTEPESLPAALKDIDKVVHSAAHLGDWGDAEIFRAINVYALEHLLTAAQHEGNLQRWIQISSLGVYAAEHHHGTDETTPADLSGLDGYTQTKAEAESLIRRYVVQFDFPAVILRPGFLYGPGDRHVVPRIIEKIAAGKMKLIGDGQKLLNNTNVHNLVDAIMLALEAPGIDGETFNVRDERLVSREEFVGAVADYMGKPRPPKVPEWLAKLAVGPIENVARILGAKSAPLLTRARMKFMTLNLDFSIAKAKQKLDYQPQIDFQQGIREALDWAAKENMIPGMAVSELKASA